MIAPGADVKEGQPVMELETDKAVIEVPSSVSGVVSEVRVKEGDKLKVGQVIFTVENGAGTKAAGRKVPTPSDTTPPSKGEKEAIDGAAGVSPRPDERDPSTSSGQSARPSNATPAPPVERRASA